MTRLARATAIVSSLGVAAALTACGSDSDTLTVYSAQHESLVRAMLAAMEQRSFVVATAFIKTEPIQVAVFGLLFLAEALTPLKMAAITVATLGVIVMAVQPGKASASDGLKPALLGLGGASMFAISSVGYRGALLAVDTASFIVGSSFTLVLTLVIQTIVLSAWLWLRDHDSATLHPVTQQRQLHTASVDTFLRGTSTQLRDDSIEIEWSDGSPVSTLSNAFLARFRTPSGARTSVPAERVLWDGETILERWPTVEYEEVMEGDQGVHAWIRQVATYGFCIVTGTPPTIEATRQLVARVGYVRETIFGGFWDFQADLSKADTAYTNLELLPHTDGTYSHDAPGLQLLHCLAFDGEGGQSTMVDGFRIASELRSSQPDLYDVLARVEVPGQYIGDGSHLMSSRPVFRHDRSGELVQVSFNNADRAPFLLPPDEMAPLYDYAPLFLDDAQAEIDEMGAEMSVDVELSEVSRDGDVARVRMDGYSMSATYEDGSFEMVYDGECVTTTETTTADAGGFMYAPNSGTTFTPDEEMTEDELEEWADRIDGWSRNGDAYVYFNNDWEGFAPANAAALASLVGRRSGSRS